MHIHLRERNAEAMIARFFIKSFVHIEKHIPIISGNNPRAAIFTELSPNSSNPTNGSGSERILESLLKKPTNIKKVSQSQV